MQGHIIKPVALPLFVSALVHVVILADSWYSFRLASPALSQSPQVINVTLSASSTQPIPEKVAPSVHTEEHQPDPAIKPEPEPLKPVIEPDIQPVVVKPDSATKKSIKSKPKPVSDTNTEKASRKPDVDKSAEQKAAASKTEEDFNSEEPSAHAFSQWLTTLQQSINRHKEYPFQARRRNITGNVEVRIQVAADGSLIAVEILEGKKVFYKNTRKAIEDSFPMPAPPQGKKQTITVTVKYSLH